MSHFQQQKNFNNNDKIIEYSFYLLFLLIPLILSPLNTQNVFEFNKLIALYAVTAVIIGAWLAKIISESKISFRQTSLDIPLLGFLLILTISTIFSTYMPLSFWGSTNLPMGALLPTITMIVLYYAFINHMSEKYKILNSLYILLIAGTITALYGIAQHYNLDPMPWNLNVSARAIGTIGQANGLAAFLGALIPLLVLMFFIKNNVHKGIVGALIFIFIMCLLYTNSRSGLIGLGVGGGFLILFLTLSHIKKNEKKAFLTNLLLFTLLIGIIGSVYFADTKWMKKENESAHSVNIASSFQQEAVDSTMRSRKYLWEGAIYIWKKYPILGSGPETFGDQFNLIHTKEANTTSLWNLYSTKAHNEYLHILATTGILGFISYLSIILVFLVWIFSKVAKPIFSEKDSFDIVSLLPIALASGYIIILITNIWGFSFIPTALLFFLFPAISINLYNLESSSPKIHTLQIITNAQFQKIVYLLIPIFICIIWLIEFRVWHADIRYGMGLAEMSGDLLKAEKDLRWATSLNPTEANYYAELSLSEAYISTKLPETNSEQIKYYKQKSIEHIAKSLKINPGNVYLWRKKAQIYYILSSKDPSIIPEIFAAMDETIKRAPNNPIYYHDTAVILDELRHQKKDAINMLNRSLDLKPDYYEARYHITLLFFQEHRVSEGTDSLSKLLSLPSVKTEDMKTLASQIEAISPKDAKVIENYLKQ